MSDLKSLGTCTNDMNHLYHSLFRVWWGSDFAPILVPIESSYTTSY